MKISELDTKELTVLSQLDGIIFVANEEGNTKTISIPSTLFASPPTVAQNADGDNTWTIKL